MQQVSGRRPDDSTPEQTELRARARNILRASQSLLEDALRKESELTGRPFAQQMKELDEALLSRRNSVVEVLSEELVVNSIENGPNGIGTPDINDVEMLDVGPPLEDVTQIPTINGVDPSLDLVKDLPAANTPPPSTNGLAITQNADPAQHIAPTVNGEPITNGEPPTPPMSLEGQGVHPALGGGGIPWYVEQFDPFGITVYEERWTGQQVLREMSEELSEMDEDELQELGPDDSPGLGLAVDGIEVDALPNGILTSATSKKARAKGGRKSNGWSKAGRPRRYR